MYTGTLFKINKQKNLAKNSFCWLNDEKQENPDPLIRGADPDPYQNVTDPQHRFKSKNC